jgi:hypothetical protein
VYACEHTCVTCMCIVYRYMCTNLFGFFSHGCTQATWTALINAADEGRLDIVRVLVEGGADFNIQDMRSRLSPVIDLLLN